MSKRDVRSVTPAASRHSLKTLLLAAQEQFYRESMNALQDLKSAYVEEVRVHNKLLRQRGLTFDKDEQTSRIKLESERETGLHRLYSQLTRQTETSQLCVQQEKLVRLEEAYRQLQVQHFREVSQLGSPMPEQEEVSLTYSADTTPAATPKPVVYSLSEAMAAKVQEMKTRDRAARTSAISANQKLVR